MSKAISKSPLQSASATLLPVILSFFVLSIFSLSGCNNTPVDPVVSTSTINGRIIDLSGNGIAGVSTIIGAQMTTSAGDGSFTINNVTKPYDLKLLDLAGSYCTVYQGLTTNNPSAYYASGVTQNTANLYVKLPLLNYNQTAMVVFTDGQQIENMGYAYLYTPTAVLTARWSSANPTVTGKVIVLVYTMGPLAATSYDNYGEKNLTLSSGVSDTVTFSASDLTLNPGEANVSGIHTVPAGYNNACSQLTLTFRSQIDIFSGSGFLGNSPIGTNFSFIVPTGLPSPFRLKLIGMATGSQTDMISNNIIEVQPGTSGNVLNIQETNRIISPENNATMVDTTTVFTFSSGGALGVNGIKFAGPDRTFILFTTSSTVTIPNFSQFGLELGSLKSYGWEVQKFHGLNTTDEFVSRGPLTNPNWVGWGRSNNRSFTTKP